MKAPILGFTARGSGCYGLGFWVYEHVPQTIGVSEYSLGFVAYGVGCMIWGNLGRRVHVRFQYFAVEGSASCYGFKGGGFGLYCAVIPRGRFRI